MDATSQIGLRLTSAQRQNTMCSESSTSAKAAALSGRERGYIVRESCGGALCRVKIHRIKPDLRCANRVEK